jgi:hypothetical protein
VGERGGISGHDPQVAEKRRAIDGYGVPVTLPAEATDLGKVCQHASADYAPHRATAVFKAGWSGVTCAYY